jgi:hypothetical protein
MKWFQQHFQYLGNPKYIGDAIDWILSRVELYQNLTPFQGTTFGDPRPVNLFGRYFDYIQKAGRNFANVYRIVDDAIKLFNAVAIVLRTDIGFAFSDRLLRDYCEAARRLLPWTAFYDPSSIFDILRAAYELSERDDLVIGYLTQVLGPRERATARNDAYLAAVNKGDFLAQDLHFII